jgi:hypothetical protein
MTIGYHMESLQVEFGILHLLHDSLQSVVCSIEKHYPLLTDVIY